MSKETTGKYFQLTDEEVSGIERASGIPSGNKGALIWGLRKLLNYWRQNGEPQIVVEEAKPDAE